MAKGWQRWAIAAVVLAVVVLAIVLIIQAVDAGSSSAAAPQPRKVGAPRFAGSELERDGAEIQAKMNALVTRRKRRAGALGSKAITEKTLPIHKMFKPEKTVKKASNDTMMGVIDIIELSGCPSYTATKKAPGTMQAATDLAAAELALVGAAV